MHKSRLDDDDDDRCFLELNQFYVHMVGKDNLIDMMGKPLAMVICFLFSRSKKGEGCLTESDLT